MKGIPHLTIRKRSDARHAFAGMHLEFLIDGEPSKLLTSANEISVRFAPGEVNTVTVTFPVEIDQAEFEALVMQELREPEEEVTEDGSTSGEPSGS